MFSENFTKLLVANGAFNDETTVEIIDLSDKNLTCEPLTNYHSDPYEPGNTI